MITFSDIYELMRKEKYSDSLVELPKNFLKDVSEYFKEKKEFITREDLFSDAALRTKKKLENATASFRDLLRIRKKKILNLAFVANEVGISKKDFENMLSFEKDLFESIVKILEKCDKELEEAMNNVENHDKKYRLVRFLDLVPEFLNAKGEEIGPFKKGEIANLEKEIVEILEKDKRVEVLED